MFPLPSRRNAIIVFCLVFAVYTYLVIAQIAHATLAANIVKLRQGGPDPNEWFDVTPRMRPPGAALWALGLSPFVVTGYVCFFLLRYKSSAAAEADIAAPVIPIASLPQRVIPYLYVLSELRTKIALLGSSVLISALLVLRLLSAFALVCNYPQHEMNNLCAFSYDIVKAFRDRFGPDSIWLTQGTLIGALRGDLSKNCMILNDHDFDTCYDKNLEPDVIDFVQASGLTYERFSKTYSNFDTHIRIYPDSFSLMSGHSGPLMFELQACEPLVTKLVKGCNGLDMPVPIDSETVLSREYGSDWLVPRSDNHAVICNLFRGW